MVEIIILAALSAGISPAQLLSVCHVESNFRNVINFHDGGSPSYGVCQIKLNTARLVNKNVMPSDLLHPYTNAYHAALYLKRQLSKYGCSYYAYAAYNAGSLKFNDAGEIKNNTYVKKVTNAKRNYYSRWRPISNKANCKAVTK